LVPVLHVTPILQSKSLRQVVVQLYTPGVELSAHFESTPGAKPQAWSLAVLVLEVQLI
jgi:hypothetical protein